MDSQGTIDVTIRIRLNMDITSEMVENFVREMDYEIKDTTGQVSICETEVIDYK